ncbi:MAG: glycerophosphodiester phosphodiesterase family protein [Faecalibacterium sp.]
MRPLIIAHRGASHLAPENTLTSFRLAKTLGADGFECDVQLTKDRHLVVAHDYFTDLKAGVHGNIPDMTFDELRKLDFGSWKGPEYAGEQIPTLEEVLEVAQGFQMIHIELKPYFDRDEEIADRVIDAVLDAGLEEKAVITAFEYGALRRVKERMPQMAICAMTSSPESILVQPSTFWEKLGLKKTDPLAEKLSSPQAVSEAAALLEDPNSLDEENSILLYYLKDRLDFLYSIFPGMNLAQILQQYYYQTDFVDYVAQFSFPVDYIGPEYHAFFRDKDLISNAHAHGFKVAPWPVGNDSRDDLRQLFRLDPELVVTNKPEVAIAILTGLGRWD